MNKTKKYHVSLACATMIAFPKICAYAQAAWVLKTPSILDLSKKYLLVLLLFGKGMDSWSPAWAIIHEHVARSMCNGKRQFRIPQGVLRCNPTRPEDGDLTYPNGNWISIVRGQCVLNSDQPTASGRSADCIRIRGLS